MATNTGKVYRRLDPPIKLLHGDCLEVMHTIPDGSVDMVLADLPYGTTACKWDTIIPLEPLWQQYRRLIKGNGAIVLMASQPFTTTLINSNPEWFKYCWVWEKSIAGDFWNARNKPLKAHEDIVVFSAGTVANRSSNLMPYFPQIDMSKGSWDKVERTDPHRGAWGKPRPSFKVGHTKGNLGRLPRSVIHIPNPNHDNLHPTQKPVELMMYLIRTYTQPGDTVLDNAMGSGTTIVAAWNTFRKAIGIEKDIEYFQIAQERLGQTQSAPKQLVMEGV